MTAGRRPVIRELKTPDPLTRHFVLPTNDDELNAISIVMEVLDELNAEQVERVLRYIEARKVRHHVEHVATS